MRQIKYILIIFLSITVPTVFGQTIETKEAVLSFENIEQVDVTKNLKDKEIPFWSTTASDKLIELWVDGTENISASDGKYFVELNASEIASLYFDIRTEGYDTLKLSFDHRARLSGGFDDLGIFSGSSGTMLTQYGNFKSDNTKWNNNTIEIPITEDQNVTRIVFQGISTVNDNPTIGNFIDNVRLSLSKTEVKPEKVTISLYPNPFVDYIIFETENPDSIFDVSIFNTQGELKIQQQVRSKSNINLEELEAGLFLAIITDNFTKNITHTKIIKQ